LLVTLNRRAAINELLILRSAGDGAVGIRALKCIARLLRDVRV
jgi:hypothetical protein